MADGGMAVWTATSLESALANFVRQASADRGRKRLQLIAANPDSPLARAAWPYLSQLVAAGVPVDVILGETFETRQAPSGVRFAIAPAGRQNRLIEQLCFGSAVWTAGRFNSPTTAPREIANLDGSPTAAVAAQAAFELLRAVCQRAVIHGPAIAPERGWRRLLRAFSDAAHQLWPRPAAIS